MPYPARMIAGVLFLVFLEIPGTSGLVAVQDENKAVAAHDEQSKTNVSATKTFARHHAIIMVGLPGDAAHARLFREIAESWLAWLIRLGISREHVTILTSTERTSPGFPTSFGNASRQPRYRPSTLRRR